MNRLKSLILTVLILACLGTLAFVTLPWLSTLPTVKTRIDFNQQHNIDGGATFYTDQPFLVDLLAQQENKRNQP